MKTAIYIEDGVLQLVITPESDFERDAIKKLGDTPLDAKIFAGSFYDCRGGWVRQNRYFDPAPYNDDRDKSLIVTLREGE